MKSENNLILIVEDSFSLSDFLKEILNYYQFNVVQAFNGLDAVQKASEFMPDLILMDIMMPEIDGYTTCRKIKEIDSLKNIPLIFLSALSESFDKVKAFDAGGVDFVTKPIEKHELISRIKTHIRIATLQKKLEIANNDYQKEIEQRIKIQQQLENEKNKAIENEKQKSILLKKLKEVQKIGKIGCWELDILKNEITWTEQLYELFEKDKNNYIPDFQNDSKHIHPDDFEIIKNYAANCINDGHSFNSEVRVLTNEKIKYCFVSGKILLDNENKPLKLIITVVDISEIKQKDEILREKEMKFQKELKIKELKAIFETEEKERTTFAQELHDGLGPLISSSLIYLQNIEKIEDKNLISKYLKNAIDFIKEALNSITKISNLLSPPVLKTFGIVSALNILISKLKTEKTPQINFETNIIQRFSSLIEISVFRIVSELLINSLKHSEANHINILLNCEKNILYLNYYDNGKGFDFKDVIENSTRMGWHNIINRINILNGELIFDKNTDNQIEIKIKIPLQ